MSIDKSRPDRSKALPRPSIGSDPAVVATQYFRRTDDGRVICELCPRFCQLREGQRGLCFVRACQGGEIVLTTYGRSTGFCIDPIEKKPLFHFLPGSATLSFGTAGCNLACRFCQNWEATRSRDVGSACIEASPDAIAEAAVKHGCPSVALTYNDPVIFHEYAVDVAEACHRRGVKVVAVTAGYVCPGPRDEFYRHIDAANVDLKAFSERFYREMCAGDIATVLNTLVALHEKTSVWLEITTLLIPGENDSDTELDRMTRWLRSNMGPDMPLHFSAFHPDFRLRDRPATPPATLTRARQIALANGLRHVYTGNVRDRAGGVTTCAGCGAELVARDGYQLAEWHLTPDGRCRSCATACPGVFVDSPGQWGNRRLPVVVGDAQEC